MTYLTPRATEKETESQKGAVEQTLAFWQPRSSKRLNIEDARQAIENIAGFFSQVEVWDRQDSAGADIGPGDAEVTEIRVSNGQAKKLTQEHTSCNRVPDSFAA